MIDKECICESRCCERRAQYGLGRRFAFSKQVAMNDACVIRRLLLPLSPKIENLWGPHIQNNAKRTKGSFYVLRSVLRVGTLRAQYSKCHSRHFFISPTRKRPLKKLYKGITKNTLNNNTRMCMRVWIIRQNSDAAFVM